MLSVKSIIKAEVNGKSYEFMCPPDSPLADALEANSQHKAFLLGRQQMADEAQKAQKPVEPEVIQE
jgi:hypothetical protein